MCLSGVGRWVFGEVQQKGKISRVKKIRLTRASQIGGRGWD